MKNSTKGILYASVAVLIFGTFSITSKILTRTIDGFSLSIWMIFLSTITLFLYLLFRKKHTNIIPELKKRYLFFAFVGFVGLFLQQITYLKSYELLKATDVITIFYIYPIFMIILSRFIHKEKISFASLIMILVGFLGLFVTMTNGSFKNFTITPLSLLVIFSAFLWALFSVLLKNNKSDQEVSMFLFNLFGLIFLIMLLPFIDFYYKISIHEFFGLLYLSVIATALVMILWSKALNLAKMSVCANLALLIPVVALILSSIILKEELGFYPMIGFLIILIATFINLNFFKKE